MPSALHRSEQPPGSDRPICCEPDATIATLLGKQPVASTTIVRVLPTTSCVPAA
jgi:hypothetical protein